MKTKKLMQKTMSNTDFTNRQTPDGFKEMRHFPIEVILSAITDTLFADDAKDVYRFLQFMAGLDYDNTSLSFEQLVKIVEPEINKQLPWTKEINKNYAQEYHNRNARDNRECERTEGIKTCGEYIISGADINIDEFIDKVRDFIRLEREKNESKSIEFGTVGYYINDMYDYLRFKEGKCGFIHSLSEKHGKEFLLYTIKSPPTHPQLTPTDICYRNFSTEIILSVVVNRQININNSFDLVGFLTDTKDIKASDYPKLREKALIKLYKQLPWTEDIEKDNIYAKGSYADFKSWVFCMSSTFGWSWTLMV